MMNNEEIEVIDLHKDIDPTPQEMTQEEIDALARDAVEAVLKDDLRKPFFDSVRHSLFSGSLKQGQVDGMNTLLDVLHDSPRAHAAYVLATVYHETARTMKPIAEYGRGRNYDYGRWRVNSENERYCPKIRGGAVYTFAECPHLFYGRGYVQLTWYANYEKAGAKLGVDLINNPDLAMQPDIAAKIMLQGMREGWFTGRKLDDYLGGGQWDFVNARKIINGMDKAQQIADIAQKFNTALKEMA